MSNCINCGNELIGKQSKFCSKHCKNIEYQNRIRKEYKEKTGQSLQSQKGFRIKLLLIQESGGGCVKCGYKKNIAALEFHHINSEEKLFNIDSRALGNHNIEVIRKELKKCILLCSNCHQEKHYPYLEILVD